MTWVTPTPTSPSAGEPATKFGIAIGSGATSPSVTGTRVWANGVHGRPTITAADASPDRSCRRFRRNGVSRQLGLFLDIGSFLLSAHRRRYTAFD